MLEVIAGLAVRRPWRVVASALVFAAAATVFGGGVAEVMSNDRADFDPPDSESAEARERLAEASDANPGADIIALVEVEADAYSSSVVQEEILSVAERIAEDSAVGRVSTVYDTGDPSMVSEDGYSTYIAVGLESGASGDEAAERLEEEFAGDENVTLGGVEVFGHQVVEVLDEDLLRAELIAFPILLLLSLWIFRGLVAASLPLLVAGLSVLGTLVGLRVASEAVPVSVFALNAASALSMGLAIDYSLLILSRYREEMARVGPVRQALENTLRTAGRTVLLSSLTVAAALSSLVVFLPRFFYSMAIAGVVVALLSAAAALVVLPAILGLLGRRVDALSLARWQVASEEEAHSVSSGRWYRFAHSVMRRPGLAALAISLLLLCAGLPILGVRFTAAALLFCVAVGALATSHIISLKEFGVGAALAVLIDATVVRAFLIPSLMKLLGGRLNWWSPEFLKRLHQRVGLAESNPSNPPAVDAILAARALRDLAAATKHLAETVEVEGFDPDRCRALSVAVDEEWVSFTRISSRIPPSITDGAIDRCGFRLFTLPEVAGWTPPQVPDEECLHELAAVVTRLAVALETGEFVCSPQERRALREYADTVWHSFARVAARDLGICPKELL